MLSDASLFDARSNQDMVAEKLALDTEIAVYKRLIDAMDKRLRLGKMILQKCDFKYDALVQIQGWSSFQWLS